MPEVHGPKKGIDPNLRPEWLVKKAQKPVENSRREKSVENSRREKKGTDPLGQRSQVVDQVNSGQKDEIRKSQMEQSRENIPKQMYVPQKPIIPTPKLPERVIQNDRQADLELDLEINRDFEENLPY